MNNDVLIIIAVALGTILTRVLPFLIFNDPEIIAVSITIIIHLLKENTLLSILVGTITYMICIQVIFA